MRDPWGYFARNAREHGDLVRFHVMGRRQWQLNHPTLVDAVYVRHNRRLDKGFAYQALRAFLGTGMITAPPRIQRQHRRPLAPAFTRDAVARWADLTVDAVDDWIGEMPTEVEDGGRALLGLARSITLRTLLGSRSVDAERAADALLRIHEAFLEQLWGPARLLPRWLEVGPRRRLAEAVRDFSGLADGMIAERRARGVGDRDVLDLLLQVQDAGGTFEGDAAVRDELATFFFAAHESTGGVLLSMQLFARHHPAAWNVVLEEIDRHLGGRRPQAHDVRRMPRTEAFIAETLRLRAPVWVIARQVTEPFTACGHRFAVGDEVTLPIWVLHRDPRWFQDPLAFRPERFLDGAIHRAPRYAYLPFGAPPRHCLGEHFARMVVVLTAARLAQRVRLVPQVDEPPLRHSLTVRPTEPVPLRVEVR